MSTSVSSVLILGFALLAYIYEIEIFELMIMLLFIVPNMPSIYAVVASIIILGIKLIIIVRIYPTIQKPDRHFVMAGSAEAMKPGKFTGVNFKR